MSLSTSLPKPVLLCDYKEGSKQRQKRMPLRVLIFDKDLEFKELVLLASLDLIKRHEILHGFTFKEIKNKVETICRIYLHEDDYNTLNDEDLELLKVDMNKRFKPAEDKEYDKRVEFKTEEDCEWDNEAVATIPLANTFLTRGVFEKHKVEEYNYNTMSSDEIKNITHNDIGNDGNVAEPDYKYPHLKGAMSFSIESLEILEQPNSHPSVNNEQQPFDDPNESSPLDTSKDSNYDPDFENEESSSPSEIKDKDLEKRDLDVFERKTNIFFNDSDVIQGYTNEESLNASEIMDEIANIKSSSTESSKKFEMHTRSSSKMFAPIQNVEVSEIFVQTKEIPNDTKKLFSSINSFTKRLSTSSG